MYNSFSDNIETTKTQKIVMKSQKIQVSEVLSLISVTNYDPEKECILLILL